MIWQSWQLSEALGVEVAAEFSGQKLQFNSKDVRSGDIFIAIKGNGDGHNYALDAIARGASFAIVSRGVEGAPKEKLLIVDDTLKALHQLAAYKRQHSKAKFIAITGSVGKTTTKEIVHNMLSCFGVTFASRGNFNNHLGVPLNLASMQDNIEYAVFEVGMNHAGELTELSKMIRPDIAVITTVAAAHLEFFPSVEAIADSKAEIFAGLPVGGIAIINRDNQYYQRIMQQAPSGAKICLFGKHQEASARLDSYKQIDKNVQLSYAFKQNGNLEIIMPFVPEHYALNMTIGFAIVNSLGLDPQKATSNSSKLGLLEGRGKLLDVTKGGKHYQIIADYYNANPESMKASLQYLKQLTHPRKIAIIGDMLELGPTAKELHQELVPFIVDSGASKLLLVGALMESLKGLLPPHITVKHFHKVENLLAELDNLLSEEELILIKGSNSIGLSQILAKFKVNK